MAICVACKPSSEKPASATAGAIDVDSPPPPSRPRDYEAMARALYASEPGYEQAWPVEFHIRICEAITQDFNRAVKDLGGNIGPDLFAQKVELGWGTPGKSEPLVAGVTAQHWEHPEAHETLTALEVRKRWLEYLGAFRFVEHALLKIKTDPKIPSPGVFEATASIEIFGRERTGPWRRDYGKVKLRFERREGAGWRISKMVLDHVTTERRDEKIYRDVAPELLASVPEETRQRLLVRSVSDEIHARLVSGEAIPGDVTMQPVAMDAHPGLAIVDYDRDGWDDVFVWDVRGPATLLRNVEGASFEDVSAAAGLDVRDVSAAAFADLDNDGVTDAVIGRWFGRSEILRGVRSGGGVTFLPADASRLLVLPSEVASIAIADVNKDGGLDIFFGTAAHDYHSRVVASGKAPPAADAHVDQLGPPDVFLLNRGNGVFEDATKQVGLGERRRNSLAPSFADFDDDGWVDLFVGNDFSGSDLYVNEKGVFKSISDASGATDVIYGMGASWGDVDRDGDLDLYASAMQSSAGARIMADEKNFAPNLGQRDRYARRQAARGNTILRNEGGRTFVDATAAGEPWAGARGANWAYGAQLLDVDQDGWLDAFSPNGFFTSAELAEDGVTRDL